ncbi:MAG: MucB/RseB C-terminal domain-containing protein [Burkholderiales bacterium]|nr:MucB/RseB C-terminal domain-containing protein [Burkholderiales bacterium]
MVFKLFRRVALALPALTAMNYVAAQVPAALAPTASAASPADTRSLNDWLMRMHQASTNRSYVGTFVVSAGGNMSSAKIWHVCEGPQQVERVEILTGAPRSIFRHNDQVVTFMPDHKVARSEKRESLGLFPELFQSADSRIGDFYKFRHEGIERVAGVDADLIMLIPRDSLRFGYRVWSERRNGLVVKLQTLDTDGRVIEQAAFSELQLDAPVSMNQLIQMMGKVQGYRLEKPVLVKTTASAEGWTLKAPVAGFNPMSCYKRPASSAGDGPLQWIFSDGLASVSIFVEPFDRQRHIRESSLSLGATQTLTRQLGAYWITLVGEVPAATLQAFASGLERKK